MASFGTVTNIRETTVGNNTDDTQHGGSPPSDPSRRDFVAMSAAAGLRRLQDCSPETPRDLSCRIASTKRQAAPPWVIAGYDRLSVLSADHHRRNARASEELLRRQLQAAERRAAALELQLYELTRREGQGSAGHAEPGNLDDSTALERDFPTS